MLKISDQERNSFEAMNKKYLKEIILKDLYTTDSEDDEAKLNLELKHINNSFKMYQKNKKLSGDS
jgi:hypothetical protein